MGKLFVRLIALGVLIFFNWFIRLKRSFLC